MQPESSFDQDLPLSYNGFLFVVEGSVRIGKGDGAAIVRSGQVGWLDRPDAPPDAASVVSITALEQGARVVLYAGQPQGDAIASQGPFIGDTREDIARLYQEYREGRFERLSQLAKRKGTSI